MCSNLFILSYIFLHRRPMDFIELALALILQLCTVQYIAT